MYTRRAVYNLTAVLTALGFVVLVTAVTLLSSSAGQAKPAPHRPITVSVPSPEAGPAVITPAVQPRPRTAALR